MRFVTWVLIAILFITSGCVDQPPLPTPTPTVAPTPEFTATPLPGEVLLVTQGVTDPDLLSAAQETLNRLAASSGLTLVVKESVMSAEIPPQVVIAVFLATPPDLAALTTGASQTQFVIVSPVDIPVAPNLSIILANPENLNFLAGYTAILLSNDWRAGGLLPGGTQEADLLQQAFLNGGAYFCGTCSPLYPPYLNFPIQAALPPGSDPNAWISMTNQLLAYRLNVMYVSPEAASPELYDFLVSQNLVLLGTGTPPESAAARYAGSVIQDTITPIETLWPDLIAGTGGKTVNADLLFRIINPTLLTKGLQRQAEEVISQLREGLILTRNP